MKLSRRALLRATAAGALSAPYFLRTAPTYADGAEGPHRVLVFFTCNGPQFKPGPTADGGTETSFELDDWWAPLARHKADGFFMRQCHTPGVPFGDRKGDEYGHLSGSRGALTARSTEGTGNGTGPSIDQFIGQELLKRGVVLPKRSLVWGLEQASDIVFEAAGRGVAATVNPYQALSDIAAGFGADGNTALRQALQKKHFVLDHALQDCTRLRNRLDASGRSLLDAHRSNIASLEAGISAALQRTSAACKAPTQPISSLPSTADFGARDNKDATIDAFVELMALTFTCDITRVLCFPFAGGASRLAIPSKYNVPASATVDSGDGGAQMHAWTHNGGDPRHMDALKICYNWFAERIAKFIDKLKATPDASGKPLFDTTVVVWMSEFGSGGPHSNGGLPVLFFAKGGARYKPGRMYLPEGLGDAQKEAIGVHRLYVSMCRHAGLTDIDSFGDHGSMPCGPLDWLQG